MKTIFYLKIVHDVLVLQFGIRPLVDYPKIMEDAVFKPIIITLVITTILYWLVELMAILLLNLANYLGDRLLSFKPKLSIYFMQNKRLSRLLLENFDDSTNRPTAKNLFVLGSFMIYMFASGSYWSASILFLAFYIGQFFIVRYASNIVKYCVENYNTESGEWTILSAQEKSEHTVHIK